MWTLQGGTGLQASWVRWLLCFHALFSGWISHFELAQESGSRKRLNCTVGQFFGTLFLHTYQELKFQESDIPGAELLRPPERQNCPADKSLSIE